LIEKALTNSSRAGDTILDLLSGSGSTLIACETRGRSAYVMEIDPHYCDVIIKRWEEFTGKTAVLAPALCSETKSAALS
jgi:DNA modification methylase